MRGRLFLERTFGAAREALDRFLKPRVILVIGWLWFLVYAFPGYMSPDTLWQLNQARGNEPINDWHPPVMAFIWRYLDKLVAGPFLMLVLQSLAFLLGLYVLLGRIMSKRAAAITAAVVLLLPQNIIVMAVIWKDSQMAGFLVAAIAALLSDRRGWRIFGYFLIALATAYRYNAAAPAFPLVLVMFDWERTLPWFKRLPVAFALWVGLTGAAFVVNGALTQSKAHVWAVGAAPTDLAGTLRFADDVDFDALVRDNPDVPWAKDTTDLRHRIIYWYRPVNVWQNQYDGLSAIFHFPQNDVERQALGKLWFKVVSEHPAAFLKHRHKVMIANLKGAVMVWSELSSDPDAARVMQHSRVQTVWISTLTKIVRLKFFRARFYWWLSWILICLTRRNRLAFALFASGIAHELGILAVAPAVDYRYNHWIVLTTILGVIVLFTQRRKAK